jgi:Pyridoxamine 5'-phosphate oxidase
VSCHEWAFNTRNVWFEPPGHGKAHFTFEFYGQVNGMALRKGSFMTRDKTVNCVSKPQVSDSDVLDRQYNTSMTEADLYKFLVQCKLGVLSTIGDAQVPQSALIGIAATEDSEIIFDTVKSSRKYLNLIARPACSFVIGWTGEQTVQYEGRAEELSGGELQRCQQVYFDAWPECRSHLSWPGIAYFVVRPRWIRYSDFDQNPPLIREFTR